MTATVTEAAGSAANAEGVGSQTAEVPDMATRVREYEAQPWMHLYPQFTYHAEAAIIATPGALQALSDACLEALANGRAVMTAVASDGEGYSVRVERTNTTGLGYTRCPYVDPDCKQTEADYAIELRERIAELEEMLPDQTQP